MIQLIIALIGMGRVKGQGFTYLVVHEFLGHHMIHQEIIQLAEAVSKNKKLLWYLIRATFKVVVKGGVPTSSLHLVLQKKYLRYLDSTRGRSQTTWRRTGR